MVANRFLYAFLIAALLARAFIPAGFMPDIMGQSSGQRMVAMVNCPGMDSHVADKSSDHYRPCPYAGEFMLGQAAMPPILPFPRWQTAGVEIFHAVRAIPARSVSFYSSRGPPVSFPI